MNALSLVAYTLALVFAGLGVYALIQNLYSVQNRLFAGVCFLLALANGAHAFVYSAESAAAAMQVYRSAHVFVVLTPPLLALYLLRFAERNDLTQRIGVHLALWLPTVVFLLLHLVFGIGTPYVAFVPSPYGWSGVHSHSLVSYLQTAFAVAVMLIPAFILSRSAKSRNRTATRYAHLVLATLLLAALAAAILEHVALAVPPMFPVVLSPAAVAIWVGVIRYRLLRVSLQTAADVVLGNLSVGVVVLDERFGIRDLNPAGERLLGVGGAEAQAVPILEFLVPPDRERFLGYLRSRKGTEEPALVEFRLMRADLCFPVLASSATLQTNGGDTIGYVCLFSDVSERRAMEMRLQSALRRADRANQNKSEFIASLSHEIRTPLNAILGSTDLLLEAERHDESMIGEHLRTVRAATDAALEIVNDILDLAKLEAGRVSLRDEPFELSQVLDNIAQVFRPQAVAKGLEFDLRVAETVPRIVRGDRTRVRQVLYNLTSNAVKYTAYGSVSISVEPAGGGDEDTVRFTVRDTGIGIPTGSIPSLFDPFYQVESRRNTGPGRGGTRGHHGSGLGLAITKTLLTQMGGRISVDSEEHRGSEFVAYIPLPVADPGAAGEERADHPADPESASADAAERAVRAASAVVPGSHAHGEERRCERTVLLVEDDRLNRRVVTRQLEMLGCTVVGVADGSDVVERSERIAEFDLILMDLQMPRMGGVETIRRLRELRFELPPIVVLSAGGIDEDARDALEAGAVEYVAKPVTAATLEQILARWTRLQEIRS